MKENNLADLNFRNRYSGARIGVLGSGPSLNEYKDKISNLCDIVIASNGSILSLNPKKIKVDLYISADEFSPTRDWFYKSKEFQSNLNKPPIRISPHFLLPFDNIIVPDENIRKNLLLDLKNYFNFNKELYSNLEKYLNFISLNYDSKNLDKEMELRSIFNFNEGFFKKYLYNYKIPNVLINGIPITLKGFYEEFENHVPIEEIIENFDSNSNSFFMNGTISCTATQIARTMGAKEINLFGCDFNNSCGTNYAHNNKNKYYGNTSQRCLNVFNAYLNKLKNEGIKVNHFGNTNLENLTKIN